MESICEEAEEHWDVSNEKVLRDFNEERFSIDFSLITVLQH